MSCGGIGWEWIEDEVLRLTEGQDLYHIEYLPRNYGDWPAGTAATMTIAAPSTVVINATIHGNELHFYAPKTAVTAALVPNGTRWEMILTVPADSPLPALGYKIYRGAVRRPVKG